MKLKATASVLLLGLYFGAFAAIPAQATSPTPEPFPTSSAGQVPGPDQKIIDIKAPGQDGGMSVAEFKAVLSKEAGVSYSPDPTNPTLVVTDWPEEGLSRVIQKASGAASASDAAGSQAAGGARYCVTRIPLLTMVPGGLQWGAEQTCEGDFAPQYIIATLQDTCDGPFCIVWENKRWGLLSFTVTGGSGFLGCPVGGLVRILWE